MSRTRATGSPAGYWTAPQAYIFAAIALLVGVALGYLLRGPGAKNIQAGPATPSAAGAASSGLGTGVGQSSTQSVEVKVAPLLQELQTRPNDPALLIDVGNAYYDGQQYQQAIDYYQRALKLRPEDVNVRTDMGTAMWYAGDPDGALQQFEKSLKYQPNHPQTLFNMGVVKWQGKKDSAGALRDWQQLLTANPNYPDRAKVEHMIGQVVSSMSPK